MTSNQCIAIKNIYIKGMAGGGDGVTTDCNAGSGKRRSERDKE
jgi:hypothetical protein